MTFNKRENAIAIMKGNIGRDSVGQTLTPQARQRAAEFAADVWKGNMGSGVASDLGIKHVVHGILKEKP